LQLKSEKTLAHKVVLCTWSDTFRVMLQNETWKESHQQELAIAVDEREAPLFKKMLTYMYTGTLDIPFDEVIPLLALSNYYGVIPLKDACGEILGKNIDGDNVFYLLEIVQQYACTKLNQQCAEYLAENFGDMLVSDKLMSLDVETWIEMLKTDDVQVNSEEDVLEAVIRYSDQFDEEKRVEVLEKTLPHIRFPVLSSQYLIEKVEQNQKLQNVKILHKLLHETYKYKAYPEGKSYQIPTKPRKGSVMWDSENSPDIDISTDKFTAKNSKRQNSWTNARCLPPFIEGITYREFKVTFNSYMMIGVETKECKGVRTYNQYPGQTSYGWCWYSAGQTYHSNQCTQAQSPFISGDTVGILLNTTEGKAAFYRNGKPVLANFSSIPKGKEIYAVISFYDIGDTATIIPGQPVPKDLPRSWGGNSEKRRSSRRK